MEAALRAVRRRALADRRSAGERWRAAVPGEEHRAFEEWAQRFRRSGRLTLNFHPDRLSRQARTVAESLLADGRYRSQWQTGISAGSRSALPGGDRHRWEQELFAGAYDSSEPAVSHHPVYGSWDLLFDPHGGSPRFGSSFVVLKAHVRRRATICVGDSVSSPRDVGTPDAPWSVLAGLAEQAAADALLNRPLGVYDLLSALEGAYQPRAPARELDGYIEAQVHGGVSLREDVDAIVVDPSFIGTDVESHLSGAAERYGFALEWHGGSELEAEDVPAVRSASMPVLAMKVARPDGVIDAHSIGLAASRIAFEDPRPTGDDPDSPLQQLKYLWHTVLAYGHDARTISASA